MGNVSTLKIYWSLRRYIYEQIPSIPAYYAPNVLPIPATGDRWIIVQFLDSPKIARLTLQNCRVHCAVRENADDIPLQELTAQIVGLFESITVLKQITMYDKVSGATIGKMFIENVVIRPMVAYEDGLASRAVDIRLKYMADRHA